MKKGKKKNEKKKVRPIINVLGSENQVIVGSKNSAKNEGTDYPPYTETDKLSSQESSDNNQGANNESAKSKEEIYRKGEPSGWSKLIIPLISAIIIAIIGKIPIDTEKESSTDQPQPTQLFINEEKHTEYSQFKYIECTLTSTPILPGYQVKPHPYIAVLDSEEWIYIPILGLYTQEQYSADNNGICKLEREDIITQLQDILTAMNKKLGQDYDIGCLIIIEYMANDSSDSPIKKAYELRIGQLSIPEDDAVIKVLNANDSDTQPKIDVTMWPNNKDQIIEVINNL